MAVRLAALIWALCDLRCECPRGPPSDVVTFLFTNIKSSTRRWETDADAMRVALVAHDDVLRKATEAHDGFLFSHTGDGWSPCRARQDCVHLRARRVRLQRHRRCLRRSCLHTSRHRGGLRTASRHAKGQRLHLGRNQGELPQVSSTFQRSTNGHGTVVKAGSRLAFTEGTVTDASGALVTTASSTLLVIDQAHQARI